MARKGSQQHEMEVEKTIKKLEKEGWKVINTKGVIPDAIAIKNNKCVAIEVLGISYRKNKGWHRSWTVKNKTDTYSMYDDVIIEVFKRPKKQIYIN